MDYPFENDSFGAPQKPLTEKDSAPEAEVIETTEMPEQQPTYQPQEPTYQPPQQTYQPQQLVYPSQQPTYQPQQPTYPSQQPTYQPQQPVYPSQQPQQPVYQPQQPTYQPQQGGAFGFQPEKPLMQPQQPAESYHPVQHTAVYQNGSVYQPDAQPPYGGSGYPQPNGNPYASQPENLYTQPAAPKQKSNKGLIAVIIVLSVLLAGSLAGLLTYVLVNSARSEQEKKEETPFGFTLPDNGGFFDQPATTTPQAHDESDYSDRTVPDYGGLKLEKKPADAADSKYNSEYAFNSVSDSVVGIMCFSDSDKKQLESQGSGIIISQGGYLITNAHVIGNSKTAYAINVITSDGTEYDAGVVGFDSRTDLAVLKMDDAKDLKPAVFGDSSELTLGEDIIIVGNPGGLSYQNSMTKGIVSALDRDASKKSLVKYIQTDAAINPGNSGGPALNMYGQVVGVACSKISGVTYEGMAFCIPSQTVKTIADSLIKNGYVEGRVKIGISGQAIDEETAQAYNIPQGIMVESVDKDGPCGSTKLAAEDVITAIDDEKITSFSDIYSILEKHKEGDKVTLKYYQASTGKETEEEITLAADK